jgi:hypothetical protein
MNGVFDAKRWEKRLSFVPVWLVRSCPALFLGTLNRDSNWRGAFSALLCLSVCAWKDRRAGRLSLTVGGGESIERHIAGFDWSDWRFSGTKRMLRLRLFLAHISIRPRSSS